MDDQSPHTPQWLRDEADRCFRLAAEVWDDKAQSALISYGRELEAEAEQMEAAERGRGTEAGER
jgi:hypothetical protein